MRLSGPALLRSGRRGGARRSVKHQYDIKNHWRTLLKLPKKGPINPKRRLLRVWRRIQRGKPFLVRVGVRETEELAARKGLGARDEPESRIHTRVGRVRQQSGSLVYQAFQEERVNSNWAINFNINWWLCILILQSHYEMILRAVNTFLWV